MTYTFLSLIETLDEMSCTIRVCMISGKEFEKDMKKNPIFFSIIPRKFSYNSINWVTKDSNDQVPVGNIQDIIGYWEGRGESVTSKLLSQ